MGTPGSPALKAKPAGLLSPEGWKQMLERRQGAGARTAAPLQSNEQPINFKPGMSRDTLIEDARRLYGEPANDPSASTLPYAQPNGPIAAAKWLQRVWPKGDWDYKLQSPRNDRTFYEGLGNYAYGATGKALGIPDPVLLRGAGLAQEVFHMKKDRTGRRPGYDPAWGHFWEGGSHGDDPRDQASIKKGIEDVKAALAEERARDAALGRAKR